MSNTDEKFIMSAYDLVEANGKTWRQNNLEKMHKYPLNTLVEIKYSKWHSNGACQKIHARLFVIKHSRDCDGSPLYHLAHTLPEEWYQTTPEEIFGPDRNYTKYIVVSHMYGIVINIGEDSISPVEVTPELLRGQNALEW